MLFLETFIFSQSLVSVQQCKLSASINGLILITSLKIFLKIPTMCKYSWAKEFHNLYRKIQKKKKKKKKKNIYIYILKI